MDMRNISIDAVTREAVVAALAVLDAATDRTTKESDGPCGDALAAKLDSIIRKALMEHMADPDRGPAFVRASDLLAA